MASEQLARERERLLEENRKLRLEKAALENLRRVEAIATATWAWRRPPPERVIVVERPAAAAARPRGWRAGPPEPTPPARRRSD